MPFKSEAQRGFMFVHHPEIAKRWAKEFPNQKNLPKHKKSKSSPRKAAHTGFMRGLTKSKGGY